MRLIYALILQEDVYKRQEIGLALIWITPGWDQKWDITAGSQKAFEQMLDDFASVSGYNELKYACLLYTSSCAEYNF